MNRIMLPLLAAMLLLGSFKPAIAADVEHCIVVEIVVSHVSPDGQLLELTAGRDDNLFPGDRLEVFRKGGAYLGRVQVLRTEADRSRAWVEPAFKKGAIRPGDLVASMMPQKRTLQLAGFSRDAASLVVCKSTLRRGVGG